MHSIKKYHLDFIKSEESSIKLQKIQTLENKNVSLVTANNLLNRPSSDNYDSYSIDDLNLLFKELHKIKKPSYEQLLTVQKYINRNEISIDKALEDWKMQDFYEFKRKYPLCDTKYLISSPVFQSYADHVIHATPEYEYGYQKKPDHKLYYVKFYDFCMIDIDNQNLDQIITSLEGFQNMLFYIYKTANGYHIFLMSESSRHDSPCTCEFMENLGCDPWYIIFSRWNGFKIRVSPKPNESRNMTHTFIQSYGKGPKSNSCLENLSILEKHLNLFRHKY